MASWSTNDDQNMSLGLRSVFRSASSTNVAMIERVWCSAQTPTFPSAAAMMRNRYQFSNDICLIITNSLNNMFSG